jgi:hypothetical protein
MSGKGSRRRPEDAAKVAAGWRMAFGRRKEVKSMAKCKGKGGGKKK